MGKIINNLLAYGLAHAAVDAACAAVIFNFSFLGMLSADFINLVVLYGVLAFGLQPILGFICDRFRIPRFSSIMGIILVSLGSLSISFPYLSVILLGIGNGIFHVGAGTISLNLTPKKAIAPGIFVAPGAIGLLVGTLIGKLGYFVNWHFILPEFLVCLFILIVKIPKIDYREKQSRNKNYFEIILILLMLSILIRSFIGSILVFPWKSDLVLLLILTIGVFLGKALGGIFADKFGWIKVSLVSLLVSAPLLAFGALNPALAILGIFMFNMTMPITLVAISNILPGRPAFAFGLTCLALIFGSLLVFVGLGALFSSLLILLVIIASALVLYFGLRLNRKN